MREARWAAQSGGEGRGLEERGEAGHLHIHTAHLIIRHGPIRQLHMNVPWWVGHDDRELSENLHREGADIAVDELRLEVARKWVLAEPVGRGARKGVERVARQALAHPLRVGRVHLVVNKLALVHVAAGVKVRVISQREIGVRLDDAAKVDEIAVLSGAAYARAVLLCAGAAELLELRTARSPGEQRRGRTRSGAAWVWCERSGEGRVVCGMPELLGLVGLLR